MKLKKPKQKQVKQDNSMYSQETECQDTIDDKMVESNSMK